MEIIESDHDVGTELVRRSVDVLRAEVHTHAAYVVVANEDGDQLPVVVKVNVHHPHFPHQVLSLLQHLCSLCPALCHVQTGVGEGGEIETRGGAR